MSSSIFFRFKSRKDALQINFDGTSLSVFEVKREIMSIARLGDGKDFDLDIYSSDNNEVYDDDTTQIPRSTTVLVRRLPAQRPGAGRASRYVTGQMPLHARNQHRLEAKGRGGSAQNTPPVTNRSGSGPEMTEAERLQAVMNASNQSLKADLDLSASKPMMRNTYGKTAPAPDKPLPPGYVCHRCGEKGHWIQACPTNTDPNYDGKHKFKRTTGIPRSMLEVVEKPEGVGEDGKIDPSKLDKGLMYTATGEWVRARPDQAAWQKFQDQQKVSAEQAKEVAKGDEELRERGLECDIDRRPFADPVKTPCCRKTYCRDCIENALLDNDLTCPNCGKQVLLDDLESDDETVKRLAAFEAEKKTERVRKTDEGVKSPSALGTPAKAESPQRSASVSPGPEPKAEAAAASSKSPVSKKRAAEDELENKRQPSNPAEAKQLASMTGTPIPEAPKAMLQQQQQQQQQQHQPAPRAPKNMDDFVSQMNAMAGGMPNGMNPGMSPMLNPMMNPMMMPNGMPAMGMMMPNMMGGGNGFDMMNGMGMANMGMGMPNMGMNWPGAGMMNGGGAGGGMQQPWINNNNNNGNNSNNSNNNNNNDSNNRGGMNGMPNGNNNGDGAYFRQPVNPHRHQGRQNRRQRSVDYKQM